MKANEVSWTGSYAGVWWSGWLLDKVQKGLCGRGRRRREREREKERENSLPQSQTLIHGGNGVRRVELAMKAEEWWCTQLT